MSQVQAEFDFEAQPGTAELNLTAGEILTVISNNIDGGWMEGKNARGKIGLFPASYVVPYSASAPAPPSMPPPMPPHSGGHGALPPLPQAFKPVHDDPWGASSFSPAPAYHPPSAPKPEHHAPPAMGSSSGSGGGLSAYLPQNRPSSQIDDFDDDEWTDDDEPEEQRLSMQEEIANMAMVRARALSRSSAVGTPGSRERGGGSRTDVSTDSEWYEQKRRGVRRRSTGKSSDKYPTVSDKYRRPSSSAGGSGPGIFITYDDYDNTGRRRLGHWTPLSTASEPQLRKPPRMPPGSGYRMSGGSASSSGASLLMRSSSEDYYFNCNGACVVYTKDDFPRCHPPPLAPPRNGAVLSSNVIRRLSKTRDYISVDESDLETVASAITVPTHGQKKKKSCLIVRRKETHQTRDAAVPVKQKVSFEEEKMKKILALVDTTFSSSASSDGIRKIVQDNRTSRSQDQNAANATRSTAGIGVGRSSVARSSSAGDGRSTALAPGGGGSVKIKGNFNKFSNFVKSGMESYVLSEPSKLGTPGERHEIAYIDGQVRWRGDTGAYTCTIDKPKKETKMKGLKSFIAYSVTSSLSGVQVSRRYKHFDWLHEILSSKYVTIALPPLPEKQVSGRYEEDLIDHRKHILQLCVDKICRHPVLSRSDVWLHFLTCTDEKQWKTGKRKAEKDEYVGGNFLHCISAPDQQLSPKDVESQVEYFSRNVRVMEDGSRVLTERLNHYQRLLIGPTKQNWQKLAQGFAQLGHAFKEDSNGGTASLRMSEALQNTAHHYHIMGDDYEAHAKNDIEPVLERLFSYRGTIQRVPDIVNIHRQAITKWRNTENAVVENKIAENQAVKVKHRVDTMGYVILAEINHINSEKTEDFKQFLGTYLRKQQQFYQNMANQLGELAKHFE